MRPITDIIIHCTATPAGRPVGIGEITRWHRARGWLCCGYHYVVYLNGQVAPGRDPEVIGAHCAGHNARSIGIAYVGGLDAQGRPADTRTTAQKAALRELVGRLKRLYPQAEVHGHRYYDEGKACPCFDAETEYAEL